MERRHFIAGALVAAAGLPFAARAQGKLKIATIGAGREGGALGTRFAKEGYPVMFSSRNPESLKELVTAAGPTAKAGTVAEAVAFGDVVLLVVPYTALDGIAKEYAAELAKKQLVVDVSNPIARRDGEEFVKKVNDEGGAGLYTAKLFPGAHLVRAFNAIGSGGLEKNAHRSGDPLGVPVAGDDKAALDLAGKLIKDIGFEPVVVGGLAKGKYLVPGTPLGGEQTPDQLRKAAATLS